MKSYSASGEIFEPFELSLLDEATRLIMKIPDDFHTELRCHEIARVIGNILDLPVTDGKYGVIEHSWCWTRKYQSGDSPGNILDVYSIARLPMVQLVDYGSFVTPNRDLYKCYPFPRNDIIHEIVTELIELLV